MKIVNLTQHAATPDQQEAGVFDLPNAEREQLKKLLTFQSPPSASEIADRASRIAGMAFATGAARAMIGGAPYLMAALERELRAGGVSPLYAFSVREVQETTDSQTGEVRKVSIFRHAGFVEPPL